MLCGSPRVCGFQEGLTDLTRLSGGRRFLYGSRSELSVLSEVGLQMSLLAGDTYFSCEISCINTMIYVGCISKRGDGGISRTVFLSKYHV